MLGILKLWVTGEYLVDLYSVKIRGFSRKAYTRICSLSD